MTSRPTAVFLPLAAAANVQYPSPGADRLPLVWLWIVAALVLVAAVAWLLFSRGVRARRTRAMDAARRA